MSGMTDPVEGITSADLKRSQAVDLICKTITFTDWTRTSADEVELVAMRLLEQIEKALAA